MSSKVRVEGMAGNMITESQFQIEQQYGKPIRDVLVELLNKKRNPTEVGKELFVSCTMIYQWMLWLGIKKKVSYARCECCGQLVVKYV